MQQSQPMRSDLIPARGAVHAGLDYHSDSKSRNRIAVADQFAECLGALSGVRYEVP